MSATVVAEPPLHRVYEVIGDAWANGPAAAYERMSALAVDALPGPLEGELVLDLGAGTGATSRCIMRRGGRPVALDPAAGMLRRAVGDVPGLLSVGGRGEALPLRSATCAAAVAAFSLSHMEDPLGVLRQVRGALRVGGGFAAVSYAPQQPHPAKAIVEDVAQRYGFVLPGWYRRFKELESEVGDPDGLRALAVDAGFGDVRIWSAVAETGLSTPGDLVRWRLGIPHLARFTMGLSPSMRAAFVREAEEALASASTGAQDQPWRPAVLVLVARSSTPAP